MAKDSEICEFVFQFHFKNRENPLPLRSLPIFLSSSRPVTLPSFRANIYIGFFCRLISEYADMEGKHFFGKLNEFLVDKSTQFYALELLGKIVNNQVPKILPSFLFIPLPLRSSIFLYVN
jgi:hypothetical protein